MPKKTTYQQQNYFIHSIHKYSLLGLLSLIGLAIQAQTIVKGTVIDQTTKEPVVGASVIVKSTTNGVATNIDGEFINVVNPNSL